MRKKNGAQEKRNVCRYIYIMVLYCDLDTMNDKEPNNSSGLNVQQAIKSELAYAVASLR